MTKQLIQCCERAGIRTWFLAEPNMTTAGRQHSGGTGSTVMIIQSGRASLMSIPAAHSIPKHSSVQWDLVYEVTKVKKSGLQTRHMSVDAAQSKIEFELD